MQEVTITLSDTTRFVEAARAYVGRARWRHMGRQAHALDCGGLIVRASRDVGLDRAWRMTVQDEFRYGREPWDDGIRRLCRERWGSPLAKTEAVVGDIAVSKLANGEPCHMGVIGDHPNGGLTMIHAHNLRGVIEQSLSGPVLAAVIEVYRPWRHT